MLRLIISLAVLMTFLAGPAQAEDDPFEGFNRGVYNFNNGADKYLVRPVAKGYAAVMPRPARIGVNNFFSNFIDANASLNAFLQGRVDYGFGNLTRVVVNSTLGIFGLFDVATRLNIPQYRTDFGHTLAIWGFEPGPFVMWPFLGPRTMRSSFGTVFDAYASPTGQIGGQKAQWGLRAFEIVDIRAGLLGADQLLSGDQYIFLRDAYLQQRRLLTSDGNPVDDFSEFDDGWEEDDL